MAGPARDLPEHARVRGGPAVRGHLPARGYAGLAFAHTPAAAFAAAAFAGAGNGALVAAKGLDGFVALFLANAVTYLIYVTVLVIVVKDRARPEPIARGYRVVLRDRAFLRVALVNVAMIGVGWACSYSALVVAAMVIAVGECLHSSALMPLVADLAPAALRGRYMAAIGLSWWIGLALAPTLGTQVLAASPSAALVTAAIVAVATGAYALSLERRLPEASRLTPRPVT